MAEPERDLANPLFRRGIGKAPRHQPLENAADFVEGFEGGVKPKAIRLVRAEFHLGRVEQAQERRLAGIPISDDYDSRHRFPPPELRVTLTP